MLHIVDLGKSWAQGPAGQPYLADQLSWKEESGMTRTAQAAKSRRDHGAFVSPYTDMHTCLYLSEFRGI